MSTFFQSKKVIVAAKEMVSVKTFKKWSFSKYFDYKLDDDNRIEEIKCIPCHQKWSEIVAESKKSGNFVVWYLVTVSNIGCPTVAFHLSWESGNDMFNPCKVLAHPKIWRINGLMRENMEGPKLNLESIDCVL